MSSSIDTATLHSPSATGSSAEHSKINIETLRRFLAIARIHWTGQASAILWIALGGIVAISFLSSALSGYQSYAQRDYINGLSIRNISAFQHGLERYFIFLAASLGVYMIQYFTTQHVILKWRRLLTESMIDSYLCKRAYYQIKQSSKLDNPDERMSEDIALVTQTACDLFTSAVRAIGTLIVFIPILWQAAGNLVLPILAYSFVGSFVFAKVFGRLAQYDAVKLKVEADFRYGLIRVRDNAESIAFYKGEEEEKRFLLDRLGLVVKNMVQVIKRNVFMQMGAEGYLALTYVTPIALIAPRYFAGLIPDLSP